MADAPHPSQQLSPSVPVEIDVAIIGAGVAGLACAARLKESGHGASVAICEASGRVGGRARVEQVGGYAVDVGAGWIHGTEKNPLLEAGVLGADDLVECTGANIWTSGPGPNDSTNFRPAPDEVAIWHKRLAHMSRLEAEAGSGGAPFPGVVNALRGTDDDWSTVDERFLSAFELWFGAPAEDLCVVELSPGACLGDFPGPHAVVRGGMPLVAERLLERAAISENLFLNTSVDRVEQDDEGITLHLATSLGPHALRARWVVCTVPLGALQLARPSFQPALDTDIHRAINTLQMSDYCKCILVLKDNVVSKMPVWTWTDQRLFPMVFSYYPIKNIPVVACTSIRHELGSMDDNTVLTQALSALGCNNDDVIAHHITRWRSQQLFNGSYSFSPAGCDFTEIDAFATPDSVTQNQRGLIFAGEHTHDEYQGSVHGAFLSGCRAADEIIASESGVPAS